jgi:CRISPR/Cas system-associated exonuclease Cas4 (RecB family)
MKTIQRMKGSAIEADVKLEPDGDDLAAALGEAIDQSIKDSLNGRHRTVKGFHASETNECPRYLVYMFRGVWQPSHDNARLQRIFDNGHGMHKRMGDVFERMGIVKGLEIPVNTVIKWTDKKGVEWDIPIESTCDGIINWGEDAIIEFKSIGDAGFVQRRIFKKAKPDHIRQVQIYMKATNLKKAYILYENKNTQAILIFEIDYDEEFIDKLFKKYGKIYKAFKDGKLPERYSSPSSEKCKYCNLKKDCWADNDAGVKI